MNRRNRAKRKSGQPGEGATSANKTARSRSRPARSDEQANRRRALSDQEVVRRAVSGTLNREVEVELEKQPGGRRAITLVVEGRCSPPIVVEQWEMDAMRQVPLVVAHLRGHFLRNYAVLTGQRPPLGGSQVEAAEER